MNENIGKGIKGESVELLFVVIITDSEVLIWLSEILSGILHEGILNIKVVNPRRNKS